MLIYLNYRQHISLELELYNILTDIHKKIFGVLKFAY